MKLLNVGCGNNFHVDWTNIDLYSNSPRVIAHDIRKGLPFESDTIDVIYSSHMLEHLTEHEVENFMNEAYRVLKKGGIIRICVPDLEGIVASYLDALKHVRQNNNDINRANYEWMMLELYDQTVRESSGGRMGKYLNQENIINKDFIVKRIGFEATAFWDSKQKVNNKKQSFYHNIGSLIKKVLRIIKKIVTHKTNFRNTSGEIHRWMYDSFSMGSILKEFGFEKIGVYQYNTSQILNFSTYRLDDYDGKERKPDSLYMEGTK